jgi:N-methylhydantoinase B
MTISSDRHKIGPWGLFGGKSGAVAQCIITSEDGAKRKLPSLKMTLPVAKHDIMKTITPGGGGWGDPLDRDVEKVLWDVVEGFVSLSRANSEYGVIIDEDTMTVNLIKTKKNREELRKKLCSSNNEDVSVRTL